MYAKLMPHELAERLASANTKVDKTTAYLIDNPFEYTSTLSEIIAEWAQSKKYYSEEDANRLATVILKNVAESILKD